jgi:hypothetical protein
MACPPESERTTEHHSLERACLDFRFEDLGFESVAEDFYKVFFRNTEIGEFDVEALRFRPAQVTR